MNEVIFEAFGLVITPWKLVGYLGVLMFSAAGWCRSCTRSTTSDPCCDGILVHEHLWQPGAAQLLHLRKNDSVGILSNLFPAFISGYNLYLDLRRRQERREEPAQ